MLKRIAAVLVFCMMWGAAQGQIDNRGIHQQWRVQDTTDVPQLHLGVQSLGFFKNNEFFNDLVDGYTLFGYQFSPYMSFSPSKRFRIDAGLYAQKDFGNDTFTTVAPVLSLNILHKDYTFTLGTLNGRLAHGLIEPMYDFERGLVDDLENGMQFLWHGQRFQADLWVDWQTMIYIRDPRQEEIFGGAVLNWNLYEKDFLSLRLPVQLTAFHQGGQIDTNPLPAVTFLNAAVGLALEKIYPASWFKAWAFEQYYTYYSDNGDVPMFNFKQGNGYYSNLLLKSKYLDLMLSYWKGAGYVAPKGGLLYQSVGTTAVRHESLVEENRSVLFVRLMKDYQIPGGARLGIRVQPVIDLNKQTVEFYQGVYLNYTGGFLLWKGEKKLGITN
jgi:hypothetical protein